MLAGAAVNAVIIGEPSGGPVLLELPPHPPNNTATTIRKIDLIQKGNTKDRTAPLSRYALESAWTFRFYPRS
jgi:hypothetical protein